MKKYNKQDSPRKRKTSTLLCELMAMRLKSERTCNVVLLSGPNIRAQIQEVMPLTKGTGKVLFVDKEEDIFTIAQRRYKGLPPRIKGRVRICCGSIWEEILSTKHKFSYLDYDCCISARSLLANGFIQDLAKVIKNQRLTYTGWLRVSTSGRGSTPSEDDALASSIKSQFNRFGYRCSREYNHYYRDGATMRVQCFMFSKNYNKRTTTRR